MSSVRLEGITRIFAEGGGIDHFSCDIAEGECFALLGPSGCGKTTTLRIIAGLEHPDSGKVFFDKRDVTPLPPEKRNAAMVFQSYALFPHLNVYENVAFGL
ncbi:MAG: ATP-binding cassette domain-containing protein, partial [Candidatus Hydrogenedentes bacterium]|nr:ATP-binding cassette domain-containing protein [Candidatus Hydrogenedentota bacterium]